MVDYSKSKNLTAEEAMMMQERLAKRNRSNFWGNVMNPGAAPRNTMSFEQMVQGLDPNSAALWGGADHVRNSYSLANQLNPRPARPGLFHAIHDTLGNVQKFAGHTPSSPNFTDNWPGPGQADAARNEMFMELLKYGQMKKGTGNTGATTGNPLIDGMPYETENERRNKNLAILNYKAANGVPLTPFEVNWAQGMLQEEANMALQDVMSDDFLAINRTRIPNNPQDTRFSPQFLEQVGNYGQDTIVNTRENQPTEGMFKRAATRRGGQIALDGMRRYLDSVGDISGTSVLFSKLWPNQTDFGKASDHYRVAVESYIRAQSGAEVPEAEVQRLSGYFIPKWNDTVDQARLRFDMLQDYLDASELIDDRNPFTQPQPIEEFLNQRGAPDWLRNNNPEEPAQGGDLPPTSDEDLLDLSPVINPVAPAPDIPGTGDQSSIWPTLINSAFAEGPIDMGTLENQPYPRPTPGTPYTVPTEGGGTEWRSGNETPSQLDAVEQALADRRSRPHTVRTPSGGTEWRSGNQTPEQEASVQNALERKQFIDNVAEVIANHQDIPRTVTIPGRGPRPIFGSISLDGSREPQVWFDEGVPDQTFGVPRRRPPEMPDWFMPGISLTDLPGGGSGTGGIGGFGSLGGPAGSGTAPGSGGIGSLGALDGPAGSGMVPGIGGFEGLGGPAGSGSIPGIGGFGSLDGPAGAGSPGAPLVTPGIGVAEGIDAEVERTLEETYGPDVNPELVEAVTRAIESDSLPRRRPFRFEPSRRDNRPEGQPLPRRRPFQLEPSRRDNRPEGQPLPRRRPRNLSEARRNDYRPPSNRDNRPEILELPAEVAEDQSSADFFSEMVEAISGLPAEERNEASREFWDWLTESGEEDSAPSTYVPPSNRDNRPVPQPAPSNFRPPSNRDNRPAPAPAPAPAFDIEIIPESELPPGAFDGVPSSGGGGGNNASSGGTPAQRQETPFFGESPLPEGWLDLSEQARAHSANNPLRRFWDWMTGDETAAPAPQPRTSRTPSGGTVWSSGNETPSQRRMVEEALAIKRAQDARREAGGFVDKVGKYRAEPFLKLRAEFGPATMPYVSLLFIAKSRNLVPENMTLAEFSNMMEQFGVQE